MPGSGAIGDRSMRCAALASVVGWLMLNALRTEAVQRTMLVRQSLAEVWRRHALRVLCATAKGGSAGSASAADSVAMFREPVDHSVPHTLGGFFLFLLFLFLFVNFNI